MSDKDITINKDILYKNLRGECKECFGLCCTALYFSKNDGFPQNKDAGKPCLNLENNFKCKVHNNLIKKGLKGCTSYDCFGAGQKIAQVTYKGIDWRRDPEKSQEMFDAFLVMVQVHEMMWYLAEALRMKPGKDIEEKITEMINKTEEITNLEAQSLINNDLLPHQKKVNELLAETSKIIRGRFNKSSKSLLKNKKRIAGRLNFMGQDLSKMNLKGENLSGAFLIAANMKGCDLSGTDFLGADLRDTDLCGADLSKSLYLTQMQLNSAKGDSSTKIPESLIRSHQWSK